MNRNVKIIFAVVFALSLFSMYAKPKKSRAKDSAPEVQTKKTAEAAPVYKIEVKENNPEIDSAKKRGFCFEVLSDEQVLQLEKGKKISWAYNWGTNPQDKKDGSSSKRIGASGAQIAYFPMLWGDLSGERKLREYLKDNPQVKYLLGFNEPNLTQRVGGCNLTPKQAAEIWPTLEAIANEFNLALVSPAMQYSGDALSDGKIYGTPESWLDEFIKEYGALYGGKKPRMDYIALHCYMDWPGAQVDFYCRHYSQMYGLKVFLTEFCAWENQNKQLNEMWQTQSMAQKIESMDQDECVAGYAWFMADGNYGVLPWNSFFKGKASPELSLAGLVYAYLSNSSGEEFFAEGKEISVCSYVRSSNYEKEKKAPYGFPWKFLENDDAQYKEEFPLALIFARRQYAEYQIDVPQKGSYEIQARYKLNGNWQTQSVQTVELDAGKQTINFSYESGGKLPVAWIKFIKK